MANKAQRGVFVSFEGGDGAGKTTHMRYLANALKKGGFEVLCLREPGGTSIGEKLRSVVLDPGNDAMCAECELLIYEAARAQIVHQVIEPALARGAVVLCDRFTDSTVAYQSFGRGISRDVVERANAFADSGLSPDRTILMLTGGDVQEGLERVRGRGSSDRLELESAQFHERVNAGFLQMASEQPERIRLVASDESKPETARKVFSELSDLFAWIDDDLLADESYFEQLVVEDEAEKA